MKTGFKTKLIALLLAIAMLAELSPVSAVDLTEEPAPQPSEETVAEQEPLEELPAEAEESVADEEETAEPATVVGEITELREENVKHFRMSDGTFTAVSYDQPIHYEDTAGKWQDIDNSLKYCSTDRDNSAAYKTGEGSFGVSFAASLEDDLLFSTDDGEISLFWNEASLDEASSDVSIRTQNVTDDAAKQVQSSETPADDTVSKKVIEAEVVCEKDSANTDDLFAAYVPGAESSALVYEDILPDVDLKYETSAISIKESIVVHEPQDSYIYRFLLQLDGLTPVLEEGGHISLLDADGAEQYVIPAPYMLDDNHDFCFGASYALEETEDDVWALTVTADEEWMNDSNRAYPVIIDPTIVKRSGTANGDISSTYVEEGRPTVSHPSYQQLYCGKTTYLNTGYQDIYLHVNSLPTIPYNCTVTSAAVLYCQDGYSADDSSSSVYIAAYELTNEGGKTASQSYTNWIHNLTWNTRPANSTIAMDYAKLNNSTTDTYQSWDITQAAVKWYSDMNGNTSGNNHGILLKRCDTSGGNKGVLLLNYGFQFSQLFCSHLSKHRWH